MTIYNDKKIIVQPLTLMTIAEVTLCESDWLAIARKWLTPDVIFGNREIYLLTKFRQALQSAPPAPTINKHEATSMVRYKG